MTLQELGRKLKEKHPEYKKLTLRAAGLKALEIYPQYRSLVIMPKAKVSSIPKETVEAARYKRKTRDIELPGIFAFFSRKSTEARTKLAHAQADHISALSSLDTSEAGAVASAYQPQLTDEKMRYTLEHQPIRFAALEQLTQATENQNLLTVQAASNDIVRQQDTNDVLHTAFIKQTDRQEELRDLALKEGLDLDSYLQIQRAERLKNVDIAAEARQLQLDADALLTRLLLPSMQAIFLKRKLFELYDELRLIKGEEDDEVKLLKLDLLNETSKDFREVLNELKRQTIVEIRNRGGLPAGKDEAPEGSNDNRPDVEGG